MPRESDHISQAEKNERLYTAIAGPDTSLAEFTDWAVTGLFYSALHYVDAFLDHNSGVHPSSHRNRNRHIAQASELQAIAESYLELYDRSRDARYNLVPFSITEAENLKTQTFEPIKRLIEGLIVIPKEEDTEQE